MIPPLSVGLLCNLASSSTNRSIPLPRSPSLALPAESHFRPLSVTPFFYFTSGRQVQSTHKQMTISTVGKAWHAICSCACLSIKNKGAANVNKERGREKERRWGCVFERGCSRKERQGEKGKPNMNNHKKHGLFVLFFFA